MTEYDAENKLLLLATPLKGKDKLQISSISGAEYISALFEYKIEAFSKNLSIKPKELIGKAVTVKIQDENARYFNGYVNQLLVGDACDLGGAENRNYTLSVVPWLWFLSKTIKCRIYQNQTTMEIVKTVFDDYKTLAKYKSMVKGTYPKREYCVQFNESDFDFVTRLLIEEGIAYYFTHEDGKHTLVLVDQKNAYPKCKQEDVLCTSNIAQPHISSLQHKYAFVTGKRVHTDYDFTKPKAKMQKEAESKIDLPNVNKSEHYTYPGSYTEGPAGQGYAKSRLQAEELGFDKIEGRSNCSSFFAGGMFSVKHEIKEENGSFIIVSMIFEAAINNDTYTNKFTCIPSDVHFRPRPSVNKPVIKSNMAGPQTALVVGDKGEEIHIDKYGRIKVQFYWDREGKFDSNSSCYVRVAQSFAGNKWGSQFIPRVGQEVIVEFLNGDPDRPIITGAVYNDANKPPYSAKTKSGIKTRSTTNAGDSNFNELSFDDKKGSEVIYLQAEKDLTRLIKNDEATIVKNASAKKAKTVSIEAQDSIKLIVGQSTIEMTPTSITIKSTKVDVNGEAMAVVKGGLVKIN